MISSLARPDDAQVAGLVELADVSCPEEAVVREGLRRRVGQVEVAAEDVRAAHEDLAGVGLEAQLDAGQWEADRPRSPLAFIGVRDEHQRLGHPVALEDQLARSLLHTAVKVGAERRRARDAEAKRREAVDAVGIHQPRVHRRHAEEHRGVGTSGEHPLRIEAALQQQRRPRQQAAVDADAQAVHVEEGEAEDQRVVRPPVPGSAHRLGTGQEVAVREEHTLGGARGAGRERQQGDVVRCRHVELGRLVFGERRRRRP